MTTFMTYKEECEALRQRVAELEARLERINPLLDEAADKIDALEEENARLKAECDDIKQVQFPRKLEAVAVGWKKKLAASQAYAEQLREALVVLNGVSDIGCSLVYEALALPSDTIALDAYVAEKVKEARK